jgi:hypothetical protein
MGESARLPQGGWRLKSRECKFASDGHADRLAPGQRDVSAISFFLPARPPARRPATTEL